MLLFWVLGLGLALPSQPPAKQAIAAKAEQASTEWQLKQLDDHLTRHESQAREYVAGLAETMRELKDINRQHAEAAAGIRYELGRLNDRLESGDGGAKAEEDSRFRRDMIIYSILASALILGLGGGGFAMARGLRGLERGGK